MTYKKQVLLGLTGAFAGAAVGGAFSLGMFTLIPIFLMATAGILMGQRRP